MISRWLPLIGVVVFLGTVCCWRPWLQARRYGSSRILFFRSGHWRQNLRDALGVVFAVCLVGQAIAAARWPESLSPIRVIYAPEARIWYSRARLVAARSSSDFSPRCPVSSIAVRKRRPAFPVAGARPRSSSSPSTRYTSGPRNACRYVSLMSPRTRRPSSGYPAFAYSSTSTQRQKTLRLMAVCVCRSRPCTAASASRRAVLRARQPEVPNLVASRDLQLDH
jgi:hypothetical protein